MTEASKIKGPASYFPSIEKKYGQPIEHWKEIVRGQNGKAHMQIVSLLKEVHGLGHGHANAVVAATLAEAERHRKDPVLFVAGGNREK